MNKQCANCKFWQENRHESETGECRYLPPLVESPRVDPDIPYRTWPVTFHDDWCGKFDVSIQDAVAAIREAAS